MAEFGAKELGVVTGVLVLGVVVTPLIDKFFGNNDLNDRRKDDIPPAGLVGDELGNDSDGSGVDEGEGSGGLPVDRRGFTYFASNPETGEEIVCGSVNKNEEIYWHTAYQLFRAYDVWGREIEVLVYGPDGESKPNRKTNHTSDYTQDVGTHTFCFDLLE